MRQAILRPSKSQAKARIGRALEQLPALSKLKAATEESVKWQRNTRLAISYTFGEDSNHSQEFNKIRLYPRIASGDPVFNAEVATNAYQGGLSTATALLESLLDEIEEYWPEDGQPQPTAKTQENSQQRVSNRVFVVHGRDEGTGSIVARFLESLDLEAIILQERANEGRTIIEKFEDYSDVGFAVVLCTPDDIGSLADEATALDELRPRPRQNVILELGYFWGRLGRNKVCALMDGDMEMPSDYGGVLYVPLDSAGGWKLILAREMKVAGMAIDPSGLL